MCVINRVRRDLSGTTIHSVRTAFRTNEHECHWLFDMKEGSTEKIMYRIDKTHQNLSETNIYFFGTRIGANPSKKYPNS